MHSPWSDVWFGNDPAQSLRSRRKSCGDSESAWESESVFQERKNETLNTKKVKIQFFTCFEVPQNIVQTGKSNF